MKPSSFSTFHRKRNHYAVLSIGEKKTAVIGPCPTEIDLSRELSRWHISLVDYDYEVLGESPLWDNVVFWNRYC
mgnify:CR=1 FL=1